MLLGARIGAWGGAKKGGLPYDAEVDYIESHGLEFIDTGVPITIDSGVMVKAAFMETTGNFPVLMGGQKTDLTEYIGIWEDNGQVAAGNETINNAWPPVEGTGGVFSATYNFYADREYSVDGSRAGITADTKLSSGSRNWFVFAANGDAGAETFVKARVYRIRMSIGSDIVRDFIPVRVGAQGALYDRVTGKVYGNKGGGAITYGSDKARPYDYLVEWIKSDGQAYVEIPLNRTINIPKINVEEMMVSADAKREIGTPLQHFFSTYPLTTCRVVTSAGSATGATMGVVQLAAKSTTVPCDTGQLEMDDMIVQGWTDQDSVNFKVTAGGVTVRGSHVARGTASATTNTIDRFTIFAYYNQTNTPKIYTQFLTHSQLKHMRIRSSSLGLDLDLYPCVKNGEACLYDEVSDTLLRNTAGVGALVAGKRIGAPYDYRVKWMATDGVAWVDTGFIPPSNTGGREWRFTLNFSFAQPTGEFLSSRNIYAFGSRVRTSTAIYIRASLLATTNADGRLTELTGRAVFKTTASMVSLKANNGTLDDPDKVYSLTGVLNSAGSYWAKNEETGEIGTEVTTLAGDVDYTYDKSVTIYGNRTTGDAPTNTSYARFIRIHSLVIEADGERREYLPCVKNGVGFFYETTNGEMLGNSAGSGALLFGDRIPG